MAARAAPQPGTGGALSEEKAALEAEVARLSRELEELRDREEMYRSSAKLSGRLVWCADAEGRLVTISPLFESLTGVDPEDGWPKVAHPDDRPEVRARWEHSVRTGEPYRVEFRSLMKSGAPRRVLSKAVPVRDEQGRILRWYGSTEDIEDEWQAQCARREALTRLRESEELHRFTVELTRQIVWSVEPDGSGLSLSSRYYELTGMEPDGDAAEFVHPDDREHVFSTWVAALESGETYSDECRLRMKDGEYRYFRLRAAPLRDADGQIVRWYGMTEDIHEERLAEHAHRDVEERYRLAVQATNDAVWDYDIANGMIDWSDDSAEMFRSGNRPIGQTTIQWWEDHIHPDDREAVADSLLEAIASGETHWSATYRFIRDDGSEADMLDRGFIIRDDAGKAVRAVGAMADMTERNRAEAEIRRMQAELIHVSRLSAMGAMASALAHELNQPLAAVSNYISGARRIAGQHPAPPAELLDALTAAGFRRPSRRRDRAKAARAGVARHRRDDGRGPAAADRRSRRARLRRREVARHSPSRRARPQGAMGPGRPGPGPAGPDQSHPQRGRGDRAWRGPRDRHFDPRRRRRHGRNQGRRQRPRHCGRASRQPVLAIHDDQERRDGNRPAHLPHHRRGAWRQDLGREPAGRRRVVPLHLAGGAPTEAPGQI